ncbi:hypothetical protein [Conexibacter woesei]|uniref:hypothetical protein n=1 Tax=Conexibacter woesei TaxID=191495 RepID=UPI000685A854|nr:hypothetical protein [Conexibacter woesei]
MLKPIVQAMMGAIGKPNAKVRVCTDPLLGGVSQAMKWERLDEIIDSYRGMVDVFLLCVDRDGEQGRRQRLDNLEERAASEYPNRVFLAEQAWQEIEVWVLGGHTLPVDWTWQAVRDHRDPKDSYYLPFARSKGVDGEPAEGRKTLAAQACTRYNAMKSRCPELRSLEDRVRASV